jgi:NADP-dependent 3-hydroxy acid dehydrogenase YdfG
MTTMAIVGAGPQLGMSLARRFGREGFRIGLIARDRDRLDGFVSELGELGIDAVAAPADVYDLDGLGRAIGTVKEAFGTIDVLEYSPMLDAADVQLVTEMTVDRARLHFELQVVGAVTAVKQVLPEMLERGDGAILITTGGTAIWPAASHGSACVAMGAARHYTKMLSDAVSHKGVYVGSISISQGFRGPELADLYWDMYTARDRVEVVFGDPESTHAFEVLVLRGHAQWFPIPKLLEPPEPTSPQAQRDLLLALSQALTISFLVTDDPAYEPRLQELIRRNGGDPAAPRCGADNVAV